VPTEAPDADEAARAAARLKSWRLYNPLQPFFDKSWRPSEIEPVG
jgi:hypothetical protein